MTIDECIDILDDNFTVLNTHGHYTESEESEAIDMAIEALSQPEQKVGHWIKYGVPRCDEQHYQCTNCEYYINFGMWGKVYTKEFKYCPNCGAKMVETQESEVVYAKSNN